MAPKGSPDERPDNVGNHEDEVVEPAAMPSPPTHQRTAEDVLRELESEPDPEPFLPPLVEEPPSPPLQAGEARKQVVTPVRQVDPELGRFLLAEGPLTREFIRQQLAVSGKADTYLGGLLAASRSPEEQTLYRAVAAGYRVPEVDLRLCQVQTSVALSIPREIAFKYQVVALDQIGDLLCVVFAGRPNPKAIEAVRRATGLKVRAFRAPKPLVFALLRRLQEVASPPPKPADDGQ